MDPADSADVSAHFSLAVDSTWDASREALLDCRKSPSIGRVHRLRVAGRRLLAQLRLLDAVDPKGGFNQAAKALKRQLSKVGELRDAQVQLALAQDPGQAAGLPEELVRHLKRRERRLREAVIRRLSHRKLSDRMAEASERLNRHSRTGKFERRLRSRLAKRLRKHWERALSIQSGDEKDREGLHSARISFQTYRRLAESFEAILPASMVGRIERVRSHQALLGEIRDLQLYGDRIKKWTKGKPPAPIRTLLAGLALRERKLRRESIRSGQRLRTDPFSSKKKSPVRRAPGP